MLSISVRSVGSESLGFLFGSFVSANTHLSVAPLEGSFVLRLFDDRIIWQRVRTTK